MNMGVWNSSTLHVVFSACMWIERTAPNTEKLRIYRADSITSHVFLTKSYVTQTPYTYAQVEEYKTCVVPDLVI